MRRPAAATAASLLAATSIASALAFVIVSGSAPALAGGNLEAVINNNTQVIDAVWSPRALPITWKINAQGAINNCDDGNPLCVGGVSPLTLQRAIDGMTQAFTAWQNIPSSTIAFSYAGTTTQTNIGLDNVRLITWADSNPNTCGTGTVATTPSSRLDAALTVSDANRDLNGDGIVDLDPAIYPSGTVLPAGTIVDADMAWCPAANDYVDVPVDSPTTFDIVAVGTHEIGHFHGLSHSPLIAPIATMLPFVEGTVVYQNDIRVLAQDDIIASSRFYPDPGSATGWGTIRGLLLLSDLATGADGVSVTAIDRRTGQQVAEVISVSRFTASADLPGSFRIDRLPPGDYLLAVEYFDGTATAEFDAWWDNNRYNTTVYNSNVSGGTRLPLIARPEFWNSGESASDDLAAAGTITIAAGETRDLGSIVINTTDPPAPAGWTPLNMPNGVITQVLFPTGFTFPFYGQSYTSAYVSDNANVAFGFAQDPSSHTGNFLGPNPVGGGAVPPRIGLPMTNLDPGVDNRGGRGGALDVFSRSVNDAAGERVEILFLGVPMIDTQKNNTVILRLFRSGRVEIDSRFVSAWWGIVGVSPGGPGPAPGIELDFSQTLGGNYSGAAGQAIYEHFEFIQSTAVGGRNLLSDAYDLNGSLLVFVPNGAGGYDASSPNFAILAPTAEVPGLRFVHAAGLAWDATAGAVTYNVYRGGIPGLTDNDADGAAESYGACLQTGLTLTTANDPAVPSIDQAFFYLITAANAGGDGPLGFASNGALRPNTSPCP